MEKIDSLLALIDDDSPIIRQKVYNTLLNFDDSLEEYIELSGFRGSLQKKRLIEKMLSERARRYLFSNWEKWMWQKQRSKQLEAGAELLSKFLHRSNRNRNLAQELDTLAAAFNSEVKDRTPFSLAHWLFIEKGFSGAEENYFHPRNSSLFWVLDHKEGIPISLSILYMLIGDRFGFSIEGLNYPGHFLCMVRQNTTVRYIDCYNQGIVLSHSQVGTRGGPRPTPEMVCTPAHIFKRILNNLTRAFENLPDPVRQKAVSDLLERMDPAPSGSCPQTSHQKAQWEEAQQVEHVKYGYRAIVVAIDPFCKADETWYYANESQPDRMQPWYHLLVHGSNQITYAAQSSLKKASGTVSIDHPLLQHFFYELSPGKYARNSSVWPGWS